VTGRGPWERALRADPRVTGARLAILLDLGTYMNGDGSKARPGAQRIAADTGYRNWCIEEHLRWAVRVGYLTVVRRGGRAGNGYSWPTEYAAAEPVDDAASTRLGSRVEEPSQPVSRTGLTPSQPGPGTSLNPVLGPVSTRSWDRPTESPTDRVSSPTENTGSSLLSSAERAVAGAGVVAEDETRELTQWIKDKYPDRSPAWFRTLAGNGDLADLAADWREQRTRPSASEACTEACTECVRGWLDPPDNRWPCLRCKPHLRRGSTGDQRVRQAVEAGRRIQAMVDGVAEQGPARDLADLLRSPTPTDYAGPVAVESTRLDGKATT